jgi:hypothetical protein
VPAADWLVSCLLSGTSVCQERRRGDTNPSKGGYELHSFELRVWMGQQALFVAFHSERKSALYSVYPPGGLGTRVAYQARGAEPLYLTLASDDI